MTAPGPFPPVFLPIKAVVAERRFIAGVLAWCGVPRRDRPDMVQIVTIAAWKAIEAGRFTPDPALPLRISLRSWLGGIAWRQASHYRERAVTRREIPTAEPLGLLVEVAGADLSAQIEARDALRAVELLPERCIEVLSAVARGETVRDFAHEKDIGESAAWFRFRLGRTELAAILAGRRWRRR